MSLKCYYNRIILYLYGIQRLGTYGVLLRRLQVDPTLAAIKYLILDEVHERGIDSDFTLALLLSAMKVRQDMKLIVMSATISTQKFSLYLGNALNIQPYTVSISTPHQYDSMESSSSSMEAPEGGVPVLFIPGFTFPVEEFYKTDYEEIVNSYQCASNDEDGYRMHAKRKGELDYCLLLNLLVVLIEGKEENPMLSRASGSILVRKYFFIKTFSYIEFLIVYYI
jgi:HrpA-like RNA helicase